MTNMKRYILRLFVSVLSVLLLCCSIVTAEESTVYLTELTVAEGYSLMLLDEQGDEVAPSVGETQADVYKNVVKMELTISDTLAREYVVMLLDGGTTVPGADNIRYVDQKSGPGTLVFTIYPDQMTKPGDYTLMVFSGGTQSAAATFAIEAEIPIGTIQVLQAEHGTVNVDKSTGRYGETVTVTATANSGYKLKEILVDGTAIEGNAFPITGDHTVTAVFAPEESKPTGFRFLLEVIKTIIIDGEAVDICRWTWTPW